MAFSGFPSINWPSLASTRYSLRGHGWSGPSCEEPPQCPGAPLPCSGRGNCVAGVCRCQPQAAGLDCFADAKHTTEGPRPAASFARRLEGLLSLSVAQSAPKKEQHALSAADFGITRVNEERIWAFGIRSPADNSDSFRP